MDTTVLLGELNTCHCHISSSSDEGTAQHECGRATGTKVQNAARVEPAHHGYQMPVDGLGREQGVPSQDRVKAPKRYRY